MLPFWRAWLLPGCQGRASFPCPPLSGRGEGGVVKRKDSRAWQLCHFRPGVMPDTPPHLSTPCVKRRWCHLTTSLGINKALRTDEVRVRRWNLFVLVGGGGLVTKLCPTLVTPWTVACQTPLSVEFSRQEYWSGLPFPSPEDLPRPGIDPRSPALQADALPTELGGKPKLLLGGSFSRFPPARTCPHCRYSPQV